MTTPAYHAYLLRLWRTSEAHWRASLEDAHTGERLTFATLAQLSEYLLRATAAPALAELAGQAQVQSATEIDSKGASAAHQER